MSETFSTVLWPAVAKTSDTLSRVFETCLNGIVRHFVRRAAISCLREFDDRELRDIGIVRSQIQAAVHGFMNDPDRARMG